MKHPRRASRDPLEGAAPTDWQSQIRGTSGWEAFARDSVVAGDAGLLSMPFEAGSDEDEANDSSDGPERARYRTVFISDLHLGTAGCQARALLDFLKQHPSETLYLVGDIIDGWQLRRKWFWPQSHNNVVQKLLRRARKGCRVVLVPGNHDEFARQFHGHRFGGIEVCNEAVHQTADGQRLWVVHGDHFDGVIQCAKWLAYLGDSAYTWLLRANRHFNSLRARLGLPYWSLSQYLKHKVKSALNYVNDFERAVAGEARSRGYDGVVCGHIHRPEMRTIDGTLYCNDGDWVESLSALVEHMDGRLELVHWSQGPVSKGLAAVPDPGQSADGARRRQSIMRA
jgi:UDP-2,3-diacylglucosamine pyrophosphatase LpxH